MEKSFTRLVGHSYMLIHLGEQRRFCSCCLSLAHSLRWYAMGLQESCLLPLQLAQPSNTCVLHKNVQPPIS